MCAVFFFQAEDGIRDYDVTGVQTCALPICIDIHDDYPADLSFARSLFFTPTFVLVEDGQELARIEGYPGEDCFWGLLEVMMARHINFEGQT